MGNTVKYYDPRRLLSKDARYSIVFGLRSNGKTYAFSKIILDNYVKHGKQGAYVRRMDEDIRPKRASRLFAPFYEGDKNYISKITKGEFDTVRLRGNAFYLCKFDEETRKLVYDFRPFCYAFSLSSMEHDKSTSYPLITSIFFDEFITRGAYLPDEFVLFANVISTIRRDRMDVKIYMAANATCKYACPYWGEMGIKHIKKMLPGMIDVYSYGGSNMRVAVEYAEPDAVKAKQDLEFFAFDNPQLNMISSGEWEVPMYPHCPVKYKRESVIFTYFIDFDGEMLQADIVKFGMHNFTYVYRKTTPLQERTRDIIYHDMPKSDIRYRTNISRITDERTRAIWWYYVNDKVFYQDNDVGEIVNAYLNKCLQ